MSVVRVNKSKDFTVMSNYHFRDKNLSLKAKGLLSQMLSLPESWDYTVAGLVAINKENETAITSTLKELKACGYLKVTKLLPNQTKSGRIEYVYDIFEQPTDFQEVEKQGVENLGVEFLHVENQGQYNTKQSSTKKLNTKKSNTNKKNVDDIINDYTDDAEIRELLNQWLQNRKAKRAPQTVSAIQKNLDKLDDLAKESNMSVKEYLDEIVRLGWQAFYPIKGKRKDIVPDWYSNTKEPEKASAETIARAKALQEKLKGGL